MYGDSEFEESYGTFEVSHGTIPMAHTETEEFMPIGVILNVLSVMLGGICGAVFGSKLSLELKNSLNTVFGLCSMCMGIASVVLMKNMPAVVFAMILGTTAGVLIHLGRSIAKGAEKMQKLFPGGSSPDASAMLVTVIVLFCASGTGIYGSMISGMSGDHSILIAKSILDFFTAMVFACMIGPAVSAVALPQLAVFLLLFYLARMIYPLTTPTMIDDFKACGGFIMIATGFRILKLGEFPTADMIPAMILVMPFSWLWSTWILPLIS